MIKKYSVSLNGVPNIEPNVSCIGFFDGVHLGHQELIRKTIELAKEKNVKPYLITFYPDPQDIIMNRKNKHINTFNERCKLFEKYGVEGVIIIEFNSLIMNMNGKEFVDKYLSKFNLEGLVCGFDFKYGYKGNCNYKTLTRDMKNICSVKVIDEVKYYGKKVSSTRIRDEINKGNYKLVNKLLGHEYK